jgi:hypothetical protein
MMELKEVEVYSDALNRAVVRMPSREFPGIVVQGDTMAGLLETAEEVRSLAATTGNEDLIEAAQVMVEEITGFLSHYEAVLKRHGIRLPYVRV